MLPRKRLIRDTVLFAWMQISQQCARLQISLMHYKNAAASTEISWNRCCIGSIGHCRISVYIKPTKYTCKNMYAYDTLWILLLLLPLYTKAVYCTSHTNSLRRKRIHIIWQYVFRYLVAQVLKIYETPNLLKCISLYQNNLKLFPSRQRDLQTLRSFLNFQELYNLGVDASYLWNQNLCTSLSRSFKINVKF